MLLLLFMFNAVHPVSPSQQQRDEDCRTYTCAFVTFGLVIVGMAVGFTCAEDPQCFSRKPGSNDTNVNGSATNFSRNESNGYTVQEPPAPLTSVPATRRVRSRRSGRK